MHVAQVDIPATDCPRFFWENHAGRRFCFFNCDYKVRYFAQVLCADWHWLWQRGCHGTKVGKQNAKICLKLSRSVRWPRGLPLGAVLLPAPLGYITPEDFAAMNQHHNQEQDYFNWGTVEDLRHQPKQSDIKDITPFLTPVRAIVLFMVEGEERGTSHIFARCG